MTMFRECPKNKYFRIILKVVLIITEKKNKNGTMVTDIHVLMLS